mgnify:CR=1 FL=1
MEAKRFHGKLGEEYELFKLACSHFDDLQNTVGKTVKDYFKNKEKDEIKALEIGCGPGYTTEIILNSDKRTKVIAIDNESVMIEQAKIVLNNYIKDRVKLIHADALEFLKKQNANYFDAFTSAFTLHNFHKDYRRKVLEEIYRVLKPQGIFVNGDKYVLDNESEHKKALQWQMQQFKTQYTKINRLDLIEEWTKHYKEDNKPNVIMKQGEAAKLMKVIGFKDVKIIFRKYTDAVLFAKK